jgi:hypothetical protein
MFEPGPLNVDAKALLGPLRRWPQDIPLSRRAEDFFFLELYLFETDIQ